MTARKLQQEIMKLGYYLDYQKGGHRYYRHPEVSGKLTIPFSSKELKTNIVRSVERQVGVRF